MHDLPVELVKIARLSVPATVAIPKWHKGKPEKTNQISRQTKDVEEFCRNVQILPIDEIPAESTEH
jgi:hypothetical protein